MTMPDQGKRRVFSYGVTGGGLFLANIVLRDSTWVGSDQLHTVMEVVATLLALLVGVLALLRFYSRQDSVFLYIGTGFLGTSLLDGYHAVVTATYFKATMPSALSSLIPWSWSASRLFLAVMLFLSWLAWQRERKLGPAGRIQVRTVFLGSAVFTLCCFLFFAFFPLPDARFPNIPFSRPQEYVPALFLGLALMGYLRKGEWRWNAFEHWLVLSLIVGLVTQAVFMPFSDALFDFEFDMAHLLKKVSYLCVLVGLLISIYLAFRGELDNADALAKKNKLLSLEIDERQQAERRLKVSSVELFRINEELNNFAYVASHDLKSPLRGIDQLANWITEDLGDTLGGDTREHLRLMRSRIKRMEMLLDDLLAYSRVGRSSDDIVRIDSRELIEAVFEMQSPDHSMQLLLDDEMPTFNAQKVPLELIFRNLIGNAIKHRVKPQGSIRISARKYAEGVEFSVQDDGPGIAPEHQGRVFTIFQTLKPRDQIEGSGMGLAFVKKAVESVGGRVTLESDGQNGCTFSFTWPISDIEEKA